MLNFQRPLVIRKLNHSGGGYAQMKGAQRILSLSLSQSQASSSSSAPAGPILEKLEENIKASAEREDYWNPPPGMIKLPWYHRHKTEFSSDCKYKWLKEETMPIADISLGARLNDYYKMQQLVNWLPTAKEKIDFVNPYEREWTVSEKTWHRAWLQPLVRPRRAWALPPTPHYFDPLNFYKFITKCRLVEGEEATREFQENYYKSLQLPTIKFEKRVSESLGLLLSQQQEAEAETHSKEEEEEECHQNRTKFLRTIIDDAHLVLAHGNRKLLDHRISYSPRCESFWIRSGFLSLYNNMPVWEVENKAWEPPYPKRKMRFTGDDRRRLGELSFTMRDQHAVQVRTRTPIKNLFPISSTDQVHSPLFPTGFDVAEELIFSPKVYNLYPDGDILWQCPGYEYDTSESHMFGRLAVKNISSLVERVDALWRCQDDERDQTLAECVQATAVVSLFNWLNAQAHCLGNTQYTEIQEPLTSQMILSDGQHFWFAIAQLNTLAINIDVQGFNNRRTNCCYVDGPYRLYDKFVRTKSGFFQFYHNSRGPDSGGKKKQAEGTPGLNPKVLERILQMCVV